MKSVFGERRKADRGEGKERYFANGKELGLRELESSAGESLPRGNESPCGVETFVMKPSFVECLLGGFARESNPEYGGREFARRRTSDCAQTLGFSVASSTRYIKKIKNKNKKLRKKNLGTTGVPELTSRSVL